MTFFFHIPVCLSFNLHIGNFSHTSLLYTALAVIVIDILVNLNTGYYYKGKFIMSRIKIAKNYLNNSLVIDILSVIPIFLYLFYNLPSYFDYMMLLFFLKLINFTRTFRKLEEGIRMNFIALHSLQIIKLLFTVLLFTHVFSCIWIKTGL